MLRRVATWTSVAVGLVFGAVGGLAGCHSPTGPTATELVFSFSPLDVSNITSIVPLGNLNPPGHTLPTNHIYFYHSPVGLVVTAPADGDITEIRHQSDDSIFVQATKRHNYYFGHLLLDPGFATGGKVTAGQRLGVTITTGALDLGLTNSDVNLFFAAPSRYIPQTIHTDGPLKYFAGAVHATLLPLIQRHGDDKDGRIDFDQAGRLAGNWFVEGLPAANSESVDNGPKQLSFARDVLEPTLVQVSIGGTITASGVFFVQDGAPDPANVTTANGRVAYQLFPNALRTGAGTGLLVVQLIASDRIRIEVFPAGTSLSADFTGASVVYTR